MALAMTVQERDTLYYDKERVISIIRNYHSNLRYTQEVLDDVTRSVGVAQYGIEAVMPKPQGGKSSSDTEKQVVRTIQATKHISKKLTDMKYLQDRLYRIEDEKDAIILYSVMQGKNYAEVGELLECDRSVVKRRIDNIAELLQDYN